MYRTFPWRFWFNSLLGERAWEPGGNQTLVLTSDMQQLPERKTGITTSGRLRAWAMRQGTATCAVLEEQSRRGLKREPPNFCDTTLHSVSSCLPVPGWLVFPQNSDAESPSSVPQRVTLFGSRVIADVIS